MRLIAAEGTEKGRVGVGAAFGMGIGLDVGIIFPLRW